MNEVLLGSHSGGYDPFSFDITDALGGGSLACASSASAFPTNRTGVQCKGLAKRTGAGAPIDAASCQAACCAQQPEACTVWQWCPQGSASCAGPACWTGTGADPDCDTVSPDWEGASRDSPAYDVEIVVGVWDSTGDNQVGYSVFVFVFVFVFR